MGATEVLNVMLMFFMIFVLLSYVCE